MIDKCYKCDGTGTKREIENIEEYIKNIWSLPKYITVPCTYCLGVGAMNYEPLIAQPLKAETLEKK